MNEISYSIVNKILKYPVKKPFTATGCVGYPKGEGILEHKIYNAGGKFGSSSTFPGNTKFKKVLVSISGYLNPWYDDGEYGSSINGYWMEVSSKEEGEKYIEILKHNLFKWLFQICKYSGFNNLILLKSFPEIDIEDINEELYEYFNLTQEEINYIEGSVK